MDEEIFLIDGRPVPELKVVELRKELEQRSLPKSGNKKELVDRLLNYLREERAEQNRQQLHQHSEQQQQQINVSAAPDPPIVGIPDMVAQYLAQQQIQLEAARRDADKHRASTSSTEEQAEDMVQRKNSSSEDIMPQQSASAKNDEITAAESGQPVIAEFIPEEPNTVPKMEKKPDLVGMECDEGQSGTDGNNEAEPTYRQSASSSETSTDQEDEEDKKIPTVAQDEVEIEEEIFQSDAGNKADEQQYEEQATERVEDDDRQMIEETMEEASAGEFVPDEPHGHEELKSSKETIQSTQAEQIVESSTKPIGGDELDFEQEIEEDNGNSDEEDIEEEEHEEPDDRGRKRRRRSSTPSPSPTSISSEQRKSVAKQLQDSQISTTASGRGIAEEQMDEAVSNVVDGGMVEVVENKPTSTQSDTAKQEAKEQSSVGGFGAGRRSTATSYGSGGRRRLSAADMEKETTTTMEQQTPHFVEEVTVDGFTRRRAVSPARNEVSRWIHIRGLKRPFTNRGLLELLGKFGTVDSEAFWIDSIKSNCIVTFEKPEEAKLARERLHNVVWPPASDGHLIVEYSSEEKLNRRKADDKLPPLGAMDRKLSDAEGNGGGIYPAMLPSLAPQLMGRSGLGIEGTMMVQQAPGGLGGLTIVVDNRAPDSSGPQVHIQHDKEQIHETETRKRKAEELEKSQNTLDQLFKKTKTQPHLYFLPLSSEEVAKRYKNKSTTTASSSLRPHKSVGHHRGISDRDNHHHHSASSSSGAQKGRNSGRDERHAAESSEHRRGERDRDRDHRERGGGRR